MNTTKASRILSIAVLAVGVFGIIWLYIVATSDERNLDRFLRQLSTVKIGKTRLEQWREDLNRAKVSNVLVRCQERTCGFDLRVENQSLHKMLLAPLTVIDASVGFQDGLASDVYVGLAVQGVNDKGQSYDDKGLVIRETSDVPGSCHPQFHLSVGRRYAEPGDRSWATIAMDPCASAPERDKALAINVDCLSKIGGCRNIEQMNRHVFGDR